LPTISSAMEVTRYFPEQFYGGETIVGEGTFKLSKNSVCILYFDIISPYNLTSELKEFNYTFRLDGSNLTGCEQSNTSVVYEVGCESEISKGKHSLLLELRLAPDIMPGNYSFEMGIFAKKEIAERTVEKKSEFWWYLKNETNLAIELEKAVEVPAYEENWTCSEWSECSREGRQYRTCTDLNGCGTERDKPSEVQPCTIATSEKKPACPQVITPATSPTGECKEFPTPCDVPDGWEIVGECPEQPRQNATSSMPTGQATEATSDLILGALILITMVAVGGLFYWLRIRK